MQENITTAEKRLIKKLTADYGRAQWFEDGAGISADSRRKLIRLGKAEEDIVKKVRSFLNSREALQFIAQ